MNSLRVPLNRGRPDLVPLVHQSLYGAEQGAVTSNRHQDFFQGVDLAAAHLPIDLREGAHQRRVALHVRREAQVVKAKKYDSSHCVIKTNKQGQKNA